MDPAGSGDKIPLVILGGSDRRRVDLPGAAARHHHSLTGYKGADLQIEGRALISHIIEQLEESGEFDPILVAGPAKVYRNATTRIPVIDTNQTLAQNVRLALETVRAEHPDAPVAFLTCDVLPTARELRTLLADYRRDPSPSVWCPAVAVPADREGLGAFGWKPGYPLRLGSDEVVTVLPGHLVIVRPGGLRLRFIYRLAQIAYRSRNRSISYRRSFMLLRILPELVVQDLLQVLALRPPTFTYTVIKHGLSAARKLKEGALPLDELELALSRMAVKSRFLTRNPKAGVRVPIVETVSIAEDIDTEEEARQVGARLS